MRFAFLVLGFFLGLTSAYAHEYEYRLCATSRLKGGELLFLSGKRDRPCWRIYASGAISGSNTLTIPGTNMVGFVYVFGDDRLSSDFDPIFNVKIKQYSKRAGVSPEKIQIRRKKIRTQCSPGFFGGRVKDKDYDEVRDIEVTGREYNRYHLSGRNDPGKALADFHIWFKNSNDRCSRTDSARLRSAFVLDKSEIGPQTGSGEAIADEQTPSFRKIAVEIGRGTFRGNLFSASFKVPAGMNHRIVVRDLSSYVGSDRGNLRDEIELDIRY